MITPPIIARIDPRLASDWPRSLSLAESSHLLIEGIYQKKVAETARAILELQEGLVSSESRALAESALRACEATSRHARRERDAILDACGAAGIVAAPTTDAADTEELQIHCFSIEIEAADFNRTVDVATNRGYFPMVPWKGGAWECFRRIRKQVTFTKLDSVTTRMTLKWDADEKPSNRLIRYLQPTWSDFAFVDLPRRMWPLYYVIRPVRILASRLWDHPSIDKPWPFLGTPDSLIPGLLDAARVTEEDLIIDIGCGDGRILSEAARLRNCRGLGIERNPRLMAVAQQRIARDSLERRVKLILGEAEEAPIEEADVVFLFLPMRDIPGLVRKLLSHLKRGARIIVHEQTRLDPRLKPDRSIPIFSDSSMTVAHLWIA